MTRGDFYIGIGPSARWIGSTTHDAFPSKIPCEIIIETNETMFEELVMEFLLSDRAASIIPTEGDRWAWPWRNSRLTDYTYMLDVKAGKVIASNFGSPFFDPLKIRQGEDLRTSTLKMKQPRFPIMKMEINKDGSYIT